MNRSRKEASQFTIEFGRRQKGTQRGGCGQLFRSSFFYLQSYVLFQVKKSAEKCAMRNLMIALTSS